METRGTENSIGGKVKDSNEEVTTNFTPSKPISNKVGIVEAMGMNRAGRRRLGALNGHIKIPSNQNYRNG